MSSLCPVYLTDYYFYHVPVLVDEELRNKLEQTKYNKLNVNLSMVVSKALIVYHFENNFNSFVIKLVDYEVNLIPDHVALRNVVNDENKKTIF